MDKIKLLKTAGAVAAVVTIASSPALATEGYFSHGYGVVNKSMAGAGVATGFDAMSQATNPAALMLVDPQFTADISIFSPIREFTSAGAGPVQSPGIESDRNYFFIPSLAGAYEIDSASKWGWAIYGNGGMNTTYNDPVGVFGFGKTGVDLAQLFVQGTYARELTPNVSIGIGPVLAAQRFKAFGLQAFDSTPPSADPGFVTNNGYDYSYGFGGRLGLQWEIVPALRFGASYQSRMYMSEFDDYSGLFAEQGDFDIPPALQAGLSFEAMPGLVFAADWKHIWYSQVDAVGNPIDAAALFGAGPYLGDDGGTGFGWDDINAYKFGVSWAATPTLTFRGGFSINDNPIPASEVMFNILAPAVQEQHYTLGLGWQVNPNNAVNFGMMYSPSNSVSGQDPFGAGQDITIEMYQWEASVGWTMTF